jgi:hypothetical protein
MARQTQGSEIRVGDCVTMRAEHRRFLTSSTGGDVFKVVGRDGNALVLEGPMDWHQKHRKQRTMGAHQFKKTACPIEHGDMATPHHATKKSPAQLQREINEVLVHPGEHSYEDAMDALEKKHAGVPRGGSLRSGHAPVVPAMTRKTKWSSHATVRGNKAGTWDVEAGRGLTYDRGDGRGPLLMFNLHRHVVPATGSSHISPVELDEITREIAAFLNRKKRKLKPSSGY